MYIDNPGKEERLNQINQMLIKLASHEFELDFDISEDRDLLDAVAIGIKLLGDELETTTISQDYLNSIYRGVADMLFILTTDHKIASVNNPTSVLLGYSEDELKGKTFSDLVHDIEKSYLDGVYQELYQSGFCYDIEFFIQKKNG